jgi:signal transduction histidine kinase
VDRRRVPGGWAPEQGRAVLLPDALGPGRTAGLAGAIMPVSVMGGPMACADELPDGLVIADHAGRVLVFNRAASRLTGIPARAAHGADVRQLLPLHDKDGRCWWASAKPYRGLSIRSRHPEVSLYLGDGTELLVTVSYVRGPRASALDPALPGDPVSTRGGQVRRLVIMLRGAQQRARLERTRADLVSTVAHELRSPLTSVKGFTATLLAKWERFTDDQKRVMLETVNADADRVTRLITELLDVSRIESGRMEVHRQLVSVPERVDKIVAGRVAAGDPADRYRVVIADRLPETWLDSDKVDQILGNLIENAVRHGAGTVTIVVEPQQNAGTRAAWPGSEGIAVSVRDEGDGVAPELVARIFRQFWRAKRRGGAGLGLYIVKGLVEAHGGTITVQRAPGGGAEFRFTVPASQPEFG